MVNLDQLENFNAAYVSAKIANWVAKLLNTSLSERKIFTLNTLQGTHRYMSSSICLTRIYLL